MTPEALSKKMFDEYKGYYPPHIIAEIQRDAREGTVPVEDVRPLIEELDKELINIGRLKYLSGLYSAVVAFRAKHPNLFPK